MLPAMIVVIVLVVVILLLFLWFRHVRVVLQERFAAVEIAAKQREKMRKDNTDGYSPADFTAVMVRCENIYAQATSLYEQALRQPFFMIPAAVMGFHSLTDDTAEKYCDSASDNR